MTQREKLIFKERTIEVLLKQWRLAGVYVEVGDVYKAFQLQASGRKPKEPPSKEEIGEYIRKQFPLGFDDENRYDTIGERLLREHKP